MLKKLAILLSLLVGTGAVLAEADANKVKAEGLVKKAIEFYKANGKEKTFAAINDKKGPFTDGEFYIFAYDLKGTCLAHGQLESRIGKNWIDLMDPNGVYFIKEHVKIAKSKEGSGWDSYMIKNPKTGKTQDKISFIMKVPGTDFLFGCGTYPANAGK